MPSDNENNPPVNVDTDGIPASPLSGAITIYVNDEAIHTQSGHTLTSFLGQMQLDQGKNLAIAVNDSVVSKGQWSSHELQAEDRLLLIAPVSGG